MANEPSSICFVACVESGPLEAQTVRLAREHPAFRRRARRRRDPGHHAPLRPAALARNAPAASSELGVRHERLASHPRYAWYHYLNTPIALAAAEELTDAEILCWTDSDLLFMGEPTELLLEPEIDFIAGSTDNGVVGTTGPDSPHEADWRRLCELLDIDIDGLPWVTTQLEKERIRLYFQAGVFAYRRGIGFSRFYLEMCDARARPAGSASRTAAENYTDQVCLGLAAHKMGLRWRQLDPTHNFPMASFLPHADLPDELAQARDPPLPRRDGAALLGDVPGAARARPPGGPRVAQRPRAAGGPRPGGLAAARQGLRVARAVPRRRYRATVAAA